MLRQGITTLVFFVFLFFFQGFIKPYSSNVKRDVTTDTRQMVAPRHDINAPGAVVMPRPSATHQVIIEHRDWFCIVVVRHQESLTSRKLEWKLWKGSGVEEVVRWNCLFSLSVVLLAVELEKRSSIVIGQSRWSCDEKLYYIVCRFCQREYVFSQLEHNREGLDIIDVVVDPHLSGHLRPHQRDGVVFLYECIMGLRNFNGNGAILAWVVKE